MYWFRLLRTRLRGLLRKKSVEREMEEELRFHLRMRAEENVRRGMAPDEAERAALKSFGQLGRIKEYCRDVKGGGLVESMLQDVKFGARTLMKNRGFTLVAVLTLAVGIGANTAIFSVVEAVLLRPLPYDNADRVVMLWEHNRVRNRPRNVVNPGNLMDWRDQSGSFEEVAAFVDQRYNLTGAGEPEEVAGQAATPNLFKLLGARPALGRTLLAGDEAEGGENVAVISHGLWQRRFGGSPDVLGRTLSLGGNPVTVVGVMPPDFRWFVKENSLTGKPAELWVPMALTEQQRTERRGRYLSAVALLKPGVTVEQAQSELDTVTARLEAQYEIDKGWGGSVVPLREQLAGEIRPALLVLLGAVACVLLIACVNVANLQMARAAGRRKEIALRAALGAGRLRLIRQLLTESLLLAAAGGALGLLLAHWCVEALVALGPQNLLGAGQAGVNPMVLLFTLGVTLLTGLAFGVVPAVETSRLNLSESLKESSRGDVGAGRAGRVRAVLVVAETGLALVLLVGAGLMVRSFQRLQAVDPGFDPSNLLTMRLMLPQTKYPEDARKVEFFRRVTEQLRALPGVSSASAVSALPFADIGSATSFTVEGRPALPPGQRQGTDVRVADEHYFRTMNIPVISGRTFTEQEAVENRRVAVVNEAMVRKYFPGEDPLGKRVLVNMGTNPVPTEIVGVVGDARYDKLDGELRPMVYWTPPQLAYSSMWLVVRTAGDPAALGPAAVREIQAVDREQPVADVRTMEGWLAESTARARFGTLLLGAFACTALLLAAVGLYGVLSYSVTQRRNEIGIRMALGAQARDVLKLMVGQGMRLVLVGVVLGLAGALALTRVMSGLLYDVAATDPPTFAANALLLMAVSLAACYIPARRATRVDPATALRRE
ncbi:MAG TPA: ABC transporter permease [Pyrinomonadaceae bacterium]|nr:ABC transporter permease [Pyrinomonadaceae bacterium]